MQKHTKTGDIIAVTLCLLLVASFALLPIAQAQEPIAEPTPDDCTTWMSQRIEKKEWKEAITTTENLITIIETEGTHKPDENNPCEVVFHEEHNTVLGLLILAEVILAILEAVAETSK